jgi:fructokinase
VAVGTGRLTLDVIVRAGAPPRCQVGGTCGNVLANLAYLGWDAYPLADLGDDDPGDRFVADLRRFRVRADLLRQVPGQQTPVIVHRIRHTEAGAVHSFSSRCPVCGGKLRCYEPISLRGVEELLPAVPAAQAFFFDRDSEGALLLARRCAGQGALVVFEPNYAGPETQLSAAVERSHVLKFSHERLRGLEEKHALDRPLLVVETLGADGLRYRDQRQGETGWQHLPALPVAVVRDAGGSGDWTTAGLIHLLGRSGLAGFRAAGAEQVRQALRFGQALGAWNCAFEGARGGVYAVDRQRFEGDVRSILAGQGGDPAAGDCLDGLDEAGAFCAQCGGRGG